MGDQRFRGDNVQVIAVVGGRQISVCDKVVSLEFTENFVEMARDYLNMRSKVFDEAYDGVAGKVTFDVLGRAFFKQFLEPLKNRAKNRTAGLQINIQATIVFNDGSSMVVIFPDVKFKPITITVGGRTEFGTSALDFSVSDVIYL